jgi:hypothetical protein
MEKRTDQRMSSKMQEQMQADFESLGWKCQESELDGRWTTTLIHKETSIVSSGTDRQILWNAAHRNALKHSGQLAHTDREAPHAVKHNPA